MLEVIGFIAIGYLNLQVRSRDTRSGFQVRCHMFGILGIPIHSGLDMGFIGYFN